MSVCCDLPELWLRESAIGMQIVMNRCEGLGMMESTVKVPYIHHF